MDNNDNPLKPCPVVHPPAILAPKKSRMPPTNASEAVTPLTTCIDFDRVAE